MNKTKNTPIENHLISDLQNFIYEFKGGNIDEELIYSFFSEILIASKVDSRIVVNVLEQINFGELGKKQALSIKVNEGW